MGYRKKGVPLTELFVEREYTFVLTAGVPAGLYYVGRNYRGQAGNGEGRNAYSSPVQIGSLTTWIDNSTQTGINYFGHGAYIKSDGTLWTSGYNSAGQLGNGDVGVTEVSSSIQVGTDTDWIFVRCGEFDSKMMKTDGTLWTVGTGTGDGTGVAGDKSTPVQIGTDTDWKFLSKSETSHFVIKNDGSMYSWGFNNSGQLGLGSTTLINTPVQVGTDTDWFMADGSHDNFAMAIKTDGTLWACGENDQGQLGLGDVVNVSTFVQVGTGTNWSFVVCGEDSTIALKTDGSLWSWGNNLVGELGNSTVTTKLSSPQQVGTLTDWAKITCGVRSCAAIKTDGTLWSWGANTYGQLGIGDTTNISSPVQVGSSTSWINVTGGVFNFTYRSL